MSLHTRLAELIEAIAADIKELVIGKVNTNDSRLSNSREWNAATVPRAEAEAGTAATRRAWTAARVRQSIRAAILGTVSQEEGVPTGAIIERGSNANGEYVRFADGTQICTRRVPAGSLTWYTVDNWAGTTTVSFYAPASLSFPAEFVNPIEVMRIFLTDNYYVGTTGSNIGQVWGMLRALQISTTTSPPTTVHLLAIGRWF